jgi:hypothetical protein
MSSGYNPNYAFRPKQEISVVPGISNLNTYLVSSQLTSVQQAQARVDLETNTLKQADKDKATYAAALKAAQAVNPPTGQSVADILKYETLLNQIPKTIAEHTKKQADAQAQLDKVVSSYNNLIDKINKGQTVTTKTNNAPGLGTPKPDKGDKGKAIYQYNAPMVSSAYLKRGIQVDSAGFDQLITDPGKIQDAKTNWGENKGAKGVIQMSRTFADLAPTPTNSKGSTVVDSQMYGFKFLYNPTSISMAWGIVEQFSPQFEATGQDKASAISVGLMKSAVTFSLMLNRMGDMAYLNSQGLIAGVNPYPGTTEPAAKELQMIYKRGTMYDLEYLFRATGGYSAQYHSTMLGDVTADKGWLQPMPVELHLGDGLRYLVRVSALDVQHMIFNERMVPLLTTVNVTCTRYFDGPEMFQTANANTAFDLTGAASSAATATSQALK